MRVVVLTAMVQEMRPVVSVLGLRPASGRDRYEGAAGSHLVRASVTSMGPARAAAAVTELLDEDGADAVVMVGIAGSVDPGLSIGDVVVAEEVVDGSSGAVLHPSPAPHRSPSGRLLTTDRLHGPDDLPRLRHDGVTAVDMETAAVGAVCAERGVPWFSIRAISDAVGDPSTDEAVLGLSRPDGRPRPGAAARYLLTRPGRAAHLGRLARGTGVAVRAAAADLARALDAGADEWS